MKLLYVTATGQAVSYGTVVADPVPSGLTVRDLSGQEAVDLLAGLVVWDATTLSFVTAPGATERANEATLRSQAATALDTNRTFVAIASPSNAQTLAQVKALSRQNNGLIRLAIGLLDGTD